MNQLIETPMGAAYLDAAQQGRNEWWRYLVGVALILVWTLGAGTIAGGLLIALVELDGNPATSTNPATGMPAGLDPLITLPVLLLAYVAAFIGILVTVPLVHRRPALTLVTPRPAIRWGRMLASAGVWAAILVAASVIEAALYPGRYQWTFDAGRFVLFVLIALALIPIQAAAEEMFFRGYLLQGSGLLNRQPLALALLNGLVFALPHVANPEVSISFWPVMLSFIVLGAGLALITLRDNGLEAAIGLHAANNLFVALVANYEGSALETSALFTSQLEPWYALIALVVGLVLFWVVMFWRSK